MPRGLQLVRYGGGGDFRFVDAALHVGLQRTNPEAFDADLVAAAAAEAVQLFACRCAIDESLPFPVRVMVLAMQALEAAAPAMIDMGRGNFWHGMPVLCSVAYWAAASWEVQVVASAPVPGGSRANLYFHGWLFETSRAQGRGAEVLQPLLGVFGALGSINHDCGDGDLLAAGDASPHPAFLSCLRMASRALQGHLPPSSSCLRTRCTIMGIRSSRLVCEIFSASCVVSRSLF
jgi:hypothetical protein